LLSGLAADSGPLCNLGQADFAFVLIALDCVHHNHQALELSRPQGHEHFHLVR
jgi:hypothetical protein